jgi:hypothetical protein
VSHWNWGSNEATNIVDYFFTGLIIFAVATVFFCTNLLVGKIQSQLHQFHAPSVRRLAGKKS